MAKEIIWMNSLKSALKLADSEKKLIFIHFYSPT
jgi:hypothetical protein